MIEVVNMELFNKANQKVFPHAKTSQTLISCDKKSEAREVQRIRTRLLKKTLISYTRPPGIFIIRCLGAVLKNGFSSLIEWFSMNFKLAGGTSAYALSGFVKAN